MKNLYRQLNEKLESEIIELKKQIRKQKQLLESAGAGVEGGSGIDPTFNPTQPASAQNKGYVTGLAGGDSDAIVANPIVVSKTASEISKKQFGAFTFDQKPQKPLLSNNIGLGMGLGFGDMEFAATRDFVNKYSPNHRLDNIEELDPQELGYISWKAVNDAVAMRDSQNLKNILQQWGLYSTEDNGSYPVPQEQDIYVTQDPGVAFARKLKRQQDIEENYELQYSEQNTGRKVNKILKSL